MLPLERKLYVSYQIDCIGWIFWIVSDGFYCLDRIGISNRFARVNWRLCACWFATGYMVRMDWMVHWWEGGGMEGPILSYAGTGAPPLVLEGQWQV